MSAQFTPGPWYWHTDFTGRVSLRTPDRGQLVVMDFARRGMQGAEPWFAHWPGMEDGTPRGRIGGILDPGINHPDARLIASAPGLLAALQELFGADMETCMGWDGKDDQMAAIEKARAAIARAEGRTP